MFSVRDRTYGPSARPYAAPRNGRAQVNWQQLKGLARQKWALLRSKRARAVAQQASEKQLAEWRAEQHKVDPIHK